MRVLLDQGAPAPLRSFLTDHDVATAAEQGWHSLDNGDLLNAAEAAEFEVFITTDKNLPHQQNLNGRKLAVVVLERQQWPELRLYVDLVAAAVRAAQPGGYTIVEMPARGGDRA